MPGMDFEEMGGWKAILAALTDGRDLTGAQASAAMQQVLAGEATPAQIAGFIVALRMKGETVDEMSGMVDAMLAAASPIELPEACADAIDIVGTGGAPSRRLHALNVSTMACFVVAGTGVKVCKHGNRRASSTSGSFDLLDELGVAVELDGEAVVRCVRDAGIGFCFARSFHPAMRHAGPVRAELGVPTVFNFLGPLSHPARIRRQVIGVADLSMAPTVIGVLRGREAPRAMVVHGHDALDELTTTGASTVYELRDDEVRTYELDPRDVGLDLADPSHVTGGDPSANAAIAERVLSGEKGAHRDIVVLNAAAGLWVAGRVDDLAAGVGLAQASIDQGHAGEVLERLIAVSTGADR
jgi:anthranilate phosphoribosyltransferase